MTVAGPIAIGALLLAVWLDWRLEKVRPSSPTSRIVHAAAAYAVVRVIIDVSQLLTGDGATGGERLAISFVLVLPSLVYAFLAALWLVRTVTELPR